MLLHVVARALPEHKPLVDPVTAWWLMWRLRIAFPDALAACLMPDHLHLVTPGPSLAAVRARVARLLAVVTVKIGRQRLFERVPDPEPIANGQHLERLIRYVHLNPCRAKLAKDPLCWPWSTHRGLAGAEADPWIDAAALAAVLGRPRRDFAQWLHGYVSSDPSVVVEGTAPPASSEERQLATVPIEAVRRAALAATPWSPPCLRRKLVVQLALHQAWRDPEAIARAAGITPRSARRLMGEPIDEPALRAARMCLGDVRLLLPERLVRPIAARPRARSPAIAR